MGTRALTVFLDEDKEEIAVLYRQMDGYPKEHGRELKELLAEMRIIDGIGAGDREKIVANGMSCLAAQVIAHLKKDIGNLYLYPAGTRDCGEEWVYTLYQSSDQVGIRVQAGCMTAFGLPGTKQEDMMPLYDGPIADFDYEDVERRYNDEETPEPTALDETEKQANERKKQ